MSQETPHTVSAVFTFKDAQSKNKFKDFCNGPKGLSVTRSYEGCLSLECYEKQDDPNSVVIWQKWQTQQHQEKYIKFRHEDGSFDFLGELISSPPNISGLKLLDFRTDEQQVKDIVNDMCNVDYKLGMSHMHDDCVFVRPTGNPLTKEGWLKMMTSEDVSVTSNKLLTINKLQVSGDMAYVCYTSHGVFNYKGTDNDDVAVLSSVLHRVNGEWKIVYGQRSSGRKPTEPLPQF